MTGTERPSPSTPEMAAPEPARPPEGGGGGRAPEDEHEDRRIRIEALRQRRDGTTTHARIVDLACLDRLTDRQHRAVERAVVGLVAAGIEAGLHPDDAAGDIAAHIVERQGEEAAYERVATRRGFLPL